jgi:hypothetical protein
MTRKVDPCSKKRGRDINYGKFNQNGRDALRVRKNSTEKVHNCQIVETLLRIMGLGLSTSHTDEMQEVWNESE